ncbi:MAG: hypothetical protein IID37_13420, partial [Planctomycetes bacterium]|nr:hypothetical protein [Planctomycetota bacterium]
MNTVIETCRPVLAVVVALLATGAVLAADLTPPQSYVHELLPHDQIETRVMPVVDVAALLVEDELRAGDRVPLRVATITPIAVNMLEVATVETLSDGGVVRRLRIDSPGAVFLSFKFSEFDLPAGAELHFVSVHRDYFYGPFTEAHNRSTGRFGSPPVPGDAGVIELYLPDGTGQVRLVIESVSHGYRDAMRMASVPDRLNESPAEPMDSLPDDMETGARGGGPFGCKVDIICPEGEPWLDDGRASAEGYDGQFICSGQLINNVLQDNRYLYLTASHCQWWQDPSTMAYYWNYQTQTCDGNDFPPFTFSVGSTELFHSPTQQTDLDLLELDGPNLEGIYNIYFQGWNRSDDQPAMGAMIGYPNDFPKQITITEDPVVDCASGPCPGGFGSQYWRVNEWHVGISLGGSSGSCLLNEDHQLVGVLSGGVGTNCDNFSWDEFSKISSEWSNLQPFLDPNNSGVMSIPGKDGLDVECEGDANGDGTVDPLDSGFVLARFGCPVGTGDPSCDAADQNGDGSVDPLDSGFVLAR